MYCTYMWIDTETGRRMDGQREGQAGRQMSEPVSQVCCMTGTLTWRKWLPRTGLPVHSLYCVIRPQKGEGEPGKYTLTLFFALFFSGCTLKQHTWGQRSGLDQRLEESQNSSFVVSEVLQLSFDSKERRRGEEKKGEEGRRATPLWIWLWTVLFSVVSETWRSCCLIM